MNKRYILYSKDTPLVNFSLRTRKAKLLDKFHIVYELNIDRVFNKALLPKNLLGDLNNESLLKWIDRRKAPKNRQFVEKILAAFDDSIANPLRYVDISHALSLNDAYWIGQEGDGLKWKNVNLYSHPFDEVLAYVAFTGYSQKVSGLVTSPEITTNGALKKCWSNRKDGIYLLKGDDLCPRSDGRSQATHEFYAAQVARAMGFNHVDYDLEEFRHENGEREIVCKCRLFTSENEGFIDAATFYKDMGINGNKIDCRLPETHAQLMKLIGADEYADMMLFDSLIANRDRHFGNFGVIVDNNTGKYLRPAPIFDNGFSFFYGAVVADLTKEHINEYKDTLQCKYFSLDEQAWLFVQQRHIPKLKKLFNFKFNRHPKHNIADETLELMERFVQERARQTVKLYAKSKNFSQ